MASIYENAHVTISASSSPDGQTHFLRDRQLPIFRPVKLLDWPTGDDHSTPVHARRCAFLGIHRGLGDPDSDPLEKRGWVLQERELSTRIISYSSFELQWICKTARYCECRNGPEWPRPVSLWRVGNHADTYGVWHYLVQEFSRLCLTFETDRLPAMSGLASKISKLTGSQYVAGLWKDNLVQDLCWTRDVWLDGTETSPRCYLAPTFSWVSVCGRIDYSIAGALVKPAQITFHTELVDVYCDADPLNPFGGVTNGFAKLHGPLIRAALSCSEPGDLRLGSYRLLLGSDTEDIGMSADAPVMVSKCNTSRTEADQRVVTVERALPSTACIELENLEVWCLNICRMERVSPEPWREFALVLRRSTESDTYQRLGCLTIIPTYEMLREVPIPEDVAAWRSGKGKTTIVII